MNASRRKALGVLAAACASGVAAVAMVPRRTADELGLSDTRLEAMFPDTFAGWVTDPTVVPVLPNAETQKAIEETYDQVLARTYIDTRVDTRVDTRGDTRVDTRVDTRGYRVMLSVAYGGRRNQGMDIHRPEICYPSQGFELRSDTRVVELPVGGASLPVKRLVAGHGARNEPVSYWLVIGRSVASFGYGHRIALLKYGLTGRVPDGMLVRVSSIDDDATTAYRMQDRFLHDLFDAVTPDFRRRLTGTA